MNYTNLGKLDALLNNLMNDGIAAGLNIAVVTNTIPNTGISLPFISYGGSSIMFLLVEMGLVLSVGRGIRLKDNT